MEGTLATWCIFGRLIYSNQSHFIVYLILLVLQTNLHMANKQWSKMTIFPSESTVQGPQNYITARYLNLLSTTAIPSFHLYLALSLSVCRNTFQSLLSVFNFVLLFPHRPQPIPSASFFSHSPYFYHSFPSPSSLNPSPSLQSIDAVVFSV